MFRYEGYPRSDGLLGSGRSTLGREWYQRARLPEEVPEKTGELSHDPLRFCLDLLAAQGQPGTGNPSAGSDLTGPLSCVLLAVAKGDQKGYELRRVEGNPACPYRLPDPLVVLRFGVSGGMRLICHR
ncbi:hypothetical protein [Rhizocola hellebori]|uniref:hypothetical protein n=1 Tax=Rhizocola hellebori TaxID=1392758 RepID=UPI001943F340|nr:hypothetical protein [Rhizocola hellebori]